ncbi:GNAT family N-acetyltransferase [Tateyamaria sp. SN3-11]|uniref:GNAT family N-acetyltransferase n=1 Tax=Tateyamaria sp. SN3-11 TaxID=3092147 RepID=UPI0039EC5CB9
MRDAFPGFDPQPVLKGRGLVLRPLASGDREALYAAASDPLIWVQHPASTRHERAVFDPYFDGLLARGTALAIREEGTERIIGTSSYYVAQDDSPALSIGFTFLERAHWGGTTNAALKALMINHLFQATDAAWFHIGPDNKRSRYATEKLGARFVHQRHLDLGNGEGLYDCLRLDRDAWKGRSV